MKIYILVPLASMQLYLSCCPLELISYFSYINSFCKNKIEITVILLCSAAIKNISMRFSAENKDAVEGMFSLVCCNICMLHFYHKTLSLV